MVGTFGAEASTDLNPSLTYSFQAATQLGYQAVAHAHLDDLLEHELDDAMPVPEGVEAVYDPAPMKDVQNWVLDEASEILFVYGEYDPWTGGAFEIDPSRATIKLTVPQANHGAVIRRLGDEDRELALDTIERWLAVRPAITPSWRPTAAPLPPGLMFESLRD